MAGRKGKPSGAVDRQGGIAKAKEAARRGASERAAERALERDEPARDKRGGAKRGESSLPAASGGAQRDAGRD